MRRILITIFAVVVLATVVIAYFGSAWAEKKIEEKIQLIAFLDYDSLKINVAKRSLRLYNLEGNQSGYSGRIEMLEIQGLQLIPILRGNKFNVKSVVAKGLNLTYQLNTQRKKKNPATENSASQEDKIPAFNIKSIAVEEGLFTILDEDGELVFTTQIMASLVNLTDEDIAKPRTIPSKLNQLQLDSARYFTGNGLYNLNVASTQYHAKSLKIIDVSIMSNKGKYELGEHVGHEIEWWNATIDSVKLELSNIASLLKEPRIKKMELYQPKVEAFRDKRLPFPKGQAPPLVRDILSNKEFTFSFDSINILNGNIAYEAFVKEEKGPGSISFHDIDATITGLTSYSIDSQVHPRLIASCNLYGKSKLYADVSFPNNAQSSNTIVKGKLLNTDLTIFNRMIQYVSVVEIKSGSSEFLEFDFTHTDTYSTGEMKFAYNDLTVSYLKTQETDPDGFMNIMKSLFVNTFVIDRNNNFQTDKFRVGKIDFERDPEKSIFNFWSSSILTGFKSSTGVDATGEKIDVN